MTRILDFQNGDNLQTLKNIWNEVLELSNNSHIFLTWDWVSIWWKYFGDNRELLTVAVENKDGIASIAPLMITKYSFLGIEFKNVEFIGTPDSDYGGFILTDPKINNLNTILNHILKYSDRWHYLTLKNIPEYNTCAKFLPILLDSDQKFVREKSYECPYLLLPSSYENFYKNLGRKFRSNLRHRENQLRRIGNIDYKTHEDFKSLDNAMKTLFVLNNKRRRSIGQRGFFEDPNKQAFHMEVARRFAEKGWLKMGFLTIDDDVVSAEYSFEYNRKLYAYQSGFDPKYGKYSVGRVCELYHIKDSIEKGIREYDWLRGFEPYIKEWTNHYNNNLEMRFSKNKILLNFYLLNRKRRKLFKNVLRKLPRAIKERTMNLDKI